MSREIRIRYCNAAIGRAFWLGALGHMQAVIRAPYVLHAVIHTCSTEARVIAYSSVVYSVVYMRPFTLL